MMRAFHPGPMAAILSLLALAACQTSMDDSSPRPAPRTPAGTVSAQPSSPAAAAAAEARTGIIPDTL
ncbi:hypothetical protein [Paracoccus contaminans]|uniref:Argininosuccinate lyase n=1 Tax=Paracoccus contaminans TaxID=1945662 RepID=A0A1W6CUM7_9RHOB|nr:hypothetical protein [Paracoccus contaminans]ARJ68509.1 hypothetical protein B0A89_01450 [Paracoccus contaminans]